MTPDQIKEARQLAEEYCRPTGHCLVADAIQALAAECERLREHSKLLEASNRGRAERMRDKDAAIERLTKERDYNHEAADKHRQVAAELQTSLDAVAVLAGDACRERDTLRAQLAEIKQLCSSTDAEMQRRGMQLAEARAALAAIAYDSIEPFTTLANNALAKLAPSPAQPAKEHARCSTCDGYDCDKCERHAKLGGGA